MSQQTSTEPNTDPPLPGGGARTSFGRVYASTQKRPSGVQIGAARGSATAPEKGPEQAPVDPRTSEAFVAALETLKTKVADADRRVAEMKAESGIDTADLEASLAVPRDLVASATTLEQLGAADKPLQAFEAAYPKMQTRSAARAKARARFTKSRTTAGAAASEAQGLPGAHGADRVPAVDTPVQSIRDVLARADRAAESPSATAEDLGAAADELDGVTRILATARAAAEVVKPAMASIAAADAALAALAGYRFVDGAAATAALTEARGLLTRAVDVGGVSAAKTKADEALAAAGRLRETAKVLIERTESIRRELAETESALASLQGVAEYGPLVVLARAMSASIATSRADLGRAKDADEIRRVGDFAVEIGRNLAAARELSSQGASAIMAIDEVRSRIERFKSLGYVDVSTAERHLAEVAHGVATAPDAKAAGVWLKQLPRVDKRVDDAKKAAAPAEKAHGKYQAALRTANEALARILALEGATPGGGAPANDALVRIVTLLEGRLATAATFADARTVTGFKDACGFLEDFGAFEKKAAAISVEVHAATKADFKAQADYDREMEALTSVIAQLQELPGQQPAHLAALGLGSQARACLVRDGAFTRGYAKAVALLTDAKKGSAAILANAKSDEKARTKDAKYDPAVLGAHTAALRVVAPMGEVEELVPMTLYRAWRAELRAALEQGLLTKDLDDAGKTRNREAALAQIAKVESAATAEAAEVRPIKTSVAAWLKTVEATTLAELRKVAPSGVIDGALDEIKRIRTVEVASANWRAASKRIENLERDLASQQQKATGDAASWRTAKADMETSLAEAEPLLAAWPERAGPLAGILPEMRLLISQTESSRAFAAGATGSVELLKSCRDQLAAMKASVGGADLAVVTAARKKVAAAAQADIDRAEMAVKAFLAAHLAGVKNTGAVGPIAAIDAAVLAWRKFAAAPAVGAYRDFDAAFAAAAKSLHDALADAQAKLATAERTVEGLTALQQEGRAADRRDEDEKRPQVLDAKIALLAARGGDVKAFRAALKIPGADLAKVEVKVDAELAILAAATKARVADGMKKLKKFEDFARKEQGTKQTFKPFYEASRAEAEDLAALLESGDPDLVAQAEREMAALGEKFQKAIKPGKGDKTFDDVEALWGDIAFDLGGSFLDKMNATIPGQSRKTYVLERMPDTYRRLSQEAIAKVAESKTLAPKDAVALLAELHKRTQEASTKSIRLQKEYERFKETSERVMAMLEKMVAATATTLSFGTVDVDALEGKLKTKLAVAKETAKSEDRMEQAFQMLGDITAELEALRGAPDPRAALLKAEAAAKREQATVVDLCRQYEGLQKTFDKAFAAATSAVTAAKGDAAQITNLDRASSTAGKLVSSYMELRSGNPVTSALAEKSPPMDRVVQAFTTASSRLQQAIDEAKRVTRFPKGTEVRIGGDFDAVEAEWIASAGKFADALVRCADGIDSTVRATPVADGQKPIAVGPLVMRLRGVAVSFPAQAFAGPLATLRGDGDSAAKKKARELALAEVRRMNAELSKDPLVAAVCVKGNPFVSDLENHKKVLRCALKSVERESLVGV